MHKILKPEVFSEYVQKFSALDAYSAREGLLIDKEIGVAYPPYPEGLKVGGILSVLFHLHECVSEESDQIFLQNRASELTVGFLSFVRSRWPRTLKDKLRIPETGKVLGGLLESLYALCLEVAPYVPVSREEGAALGVDGPAFFHNCMKELAQCNGIATSLDMHYPPKTSAHERERKRATVNKEQSKLYLRSIIMRIQRREHPKPFPCGSKSAKLGYMGTMFHYAVTASEQDATLRKGAFIDFLKAARAYIDLISSKKYALTVTKSDGSVVLSRGKRASPKKSTLVSF